MHLGTASQMLLTEVKLSLRCTLGNPAINELCGTSTLYTKTALPHKFSYSSPVLHYSNKLFIMSFALSSSRQSYFYYEYAIMSNSFENRYLPQTLIAYSASARKLL